MDAVTSGNPLCIGAYTRRYGEEGFSADPADPDDLLHVAVLIDVDGTVDQSGNSIRKGDVGKIMAVGDAGDDGAPLCTVWMKGQWEWGKRAAERKKAKFNHLVSNNIVVKISARKLRRE